MIKVAALAIAIVGAIAVFFGLVFMLAGDEETIALAGFMWQAGDVPHVWGWVLLAGGAALLAAAATAFLRARRPRAG